MPTGETSETCKTLVALLSEGYGILNHNMDTQRSGQIKHKSSNLCLKVADGHILVAGVSLLLTNFALAPVGIRKAEG